MCAPIQYQPPARLIYAAPAADFAAWKDRVLEYSTLSGTFNMNPAQHQALFTTLLDDEWCRVIRHSLTLPESVDISSCINLLEKHQQSRQNVLVQRRRFFACHQQDGEILQDFFVLATRNCC